MMDCGANFPGLWTLHAPWIAGTAPSGTAAMPSDLIVGPQECNLKQSTESVQQKVLFIMNYIFMYILSQLIATCPTRRGHQCTNGVNNQT